MIALSCDTGLATFGWALSEVTPAGGTGVVVTPTHVGVIVTEPSARKRKVLSVEDTARRVQEIAAVVDPLLRDGAQLLCLEGLSLPRNSSSAAKMGAAWGAVVALARARGIPVLQASPQSVKRAVAGSISATKDEVVAAVRRMCGDALFDDLFRDIPGGRVEHAADAVAVAVACCTGDESVRIALAMQGLARA